MSLSFANCELDVKRRELRRAGEPVALEPRTFDLLVYLLENRDRAIDLFEKRFSLGDALLDWIDNDSDFDSIRDHPRFKAIVDVQRARAQPG